MDNFLNSATIRMNWKLGASKSETVKTIPGKSTWIDLTKEILYLCDEIQVQGLPSNMYQQIKSD